MFSDEDDHPYHLGSRIAGVVQGYRPQVDWGGDAGSATIVLGGHNVRVGTSGWRRRCLYLLLLALLALSIANLSLTMVVLHTTYFNVDGMGDLHIVGGGLDMEGSTRFMDKVHAAEIKSRKGKHLLMEGYHNLSIQTTSTHLSDSFLHLGVSQVTGGSPVVEVRSSTGEHLFDSQLNGSTVGARRLTVTGSQGALFEGSVQTPLLFSKGVHELRLESITRRLSGRGAKDVNLEARDGDISVIASSHLTLGSQNGVLRFDNPKIYLSTLLVEGSTGGGDGGGDTTATTTTTTTTTTAATTASPQETQLPPPGREEPSTTPLPPSSSSSSSSSSSVEVYQVCVCPNGRLFMMEALAECEFADNVCR
ncbi:gamma-sarcoglycan-like [Eriocheir sinensis]|uniref:gamma-sarcoglycan-like n=1 Tax=Eriocheir sinensis TaxID=95602 RepID=UPI0021C58056|nr:gamma-sarcoglycan-like [Eriocheir sinensis]